MTVNKGKVWLVGAGPSDAGLLTLKAKALLEEADVILYDSLVGDSVLGMIPADIRRIDVGKRAGQDYMPQAEINALILKEALAGNRVVRLKGGDPFLFGRGGEELELLHEHGVPFEIVPGVTSAISVPAYAGIPVTHRDFCSSVHIITGHVKDDNKPRIDFEALVRLNGTLVFLMGIGALSHICEQLVAAGMDGATPAAVLERGTTADQRRVVATLVTLPEEARRQKVVTPAIIVVGEVCALAEQFHWAEDRPLGGVRIIVTRPKELSSRLSSSLRSLGAEVLEFPAIRTVAIENNEALQAALGRLSSYRWLVFTSQAGVEIFFAALKSAHMDVRALGDIKIAAIGSATERAITDRGLLVDLVPQKYDAASLGALLAQTVGREERVLIPRARIGSEELTRALDGVAPYDDIPVYDTEYVDGHVLKLVDVLMQKRVDYVAFTSASTVRGFAALAGDSDLMGLTAVCIGEQTALEAKNHGMNTVVSDEITIESLCDKLVALHRAARGN